MDDEHPFDEFYNPDSAGEEEVEEEVESWLSGQAYYLLAGLMLGVLVNFVGRMGAVQRGGHVASQAAAVRQQSQLWTSSLFGGDTRMYFVVRTDLKMGAGKVASQVAHAAIMLYKRAVKESPQLVRSWELRGQPKIVLKAPGGHDELVRLEAEASAAGVVTAVVRDAGHTQVDAGTATVLGIGPVSAEEANKVTGNLKLL